jgi:ABC-type uncharacterized transport system ATPase subunit
LADARIVAAHSQLIPRHAVRANIALLSADQRLRLEASKVLTILQSVSSQAPHILIGWAMKLKNVQADAAQRVSIVKFLQSVKCAPRPIG